jgi:choline kinase
MLLSNSLLYSHSRSDQNGKPVEKFQVKQGDVVKVKYEKGRVSFSVKGIEEWLAVDIGANQNLHFGVYLYSV